MNQWKYDKEIRKITQNNTVIYPKEYAEKIEQLCDGLPEKKMYRSGYMPHFPYGMVAVLACLLFVIVPVSAALGGHWQQMNRMTEYKKQQYVSEVMGSQADKDNYTRALTEDEQERKEELILSYEEGTTYPVGEVVHIDSENEVQSGKICFLAATSTFYLPSRELTDEELLELIDFYYKRDYSLEEGMAQKNQKREEKNTKETETGDGNGLAEADVLLTEEEAVKTGGEWIRKIYNRDVSGWDTSVKKMDTPKFSSDIYSMTYMDAKSSAEYIVTLDNETGKILSMKCVYNGKESNVSEGMPVENGKKLRKRYKEVRKLTKLLDASKDVKSVYCEYQLDKMKRLPYGIVSYMIEYTDGSGMEVSYSYNSKEYYRLLLNDNMTEHIEDENFTQEEISTATMVRKKLQ